ncbi:hypothetical protein [Engelhardtia mirabilis]|uniref:hypothetical protein n=1 Tax=Engelhardtia mirabilis TaxID=2528011 RepID=UPI003AF40020
MEIHDGDWSLEHGRPEVDHLDLLVAGPKRDVGRAVDIQSRGVPTRGTLDGGLDDDLDQLVEIDDGVVLDE